MNRFPVARAAVAALLVYAGGAFADTIIFKSGARLEGTLVRISGDTITFSSDDVGQVNVAKAKVLTIESAKSAVVEYADKSTEEGVITLTNDTFFVSGKALDAERFKGVNLPKETWHGSVNMSATAARGNTISEKATLLADVNRRWEKDRFKADFGYYFAQSGTSKNQRTKTEDRIVMSAQEDHFWSSAVYSYVNGKFERDGINNLQYRYRLGAGMGYQWLDAAEYATGKWSFNQEVGAAVVKEKYEHIKGNDYPSFRYAHSAKYVPNWVSGFAITHNFEYLPDCSDWQNSYQIIADLGFTKDLINNWLLMGRAEWEYNSNPGGTTKNSDVRVTIGLGYKW